jgi:cysteinyl-tRNA synthetase
VLRLFFLSSHYRSPLDYSEESLNEGRSGLDRFYSSLKAVQDELKRPTQPNQDKTASPIFREAEQAVESFQTRFEEAMDDDFNTAQALGFLFDLQTHLNSLLNLSKGRPTEAILSLLKKGEEYFSKMGWIFGLFREDPESYLNERRKAGLKKLTVSEEEILRLIEQRNDARKEKDWNRADDLRNDLLDRGIVLEDTPSGTLWKIR